MIEMLEIGFFFSSIASITLLLKFKTLRNLLRIYYSIFIGLSFMFSYFIILDSSFGYSSPIIWFINIIILLLLFILIISLRYVDNPLKKIAKDDFFYSSLDGKYIIDYLLSVDKEKFDNLCWKYVNAENSTNFVFIMEEKTSQKN